MDELNGKYHPDKLIKSLFPDDEIEQERAMIRWTHVMSEYRIYKIMHPNTKLSDKQIFAKVKRGIVFRTVRDYFSRIYFTTYLETKLFFRRLIAKLNNKNDKNRT